MEEGAVVERCTVCGLLKLRVGPGERDVFLSRRRTLCLEASAAMELSMSVLGGFVLSVMSPVEVVFSCGSGVAKASILAGACSGVFTARGLCQDVVRSDEILLAV